MTWVERNRQHIENIRAYVAGFRSVRPSPFEYFQGGSTPLFPLAPESDRGTAMLLFFCALYQNIREEKLMRVLAFLWKEYDRDLFRLNKLPFGDLQARLQRLTDLADWEIWPKVPGILRSACDFCFQHGRLLPWAQAQADGEACVRILSEEIFLMGKTSPLKSKPRYFLWLLTQLPGAEPERFWTSNTLLPITRGHLRFLREFGPLKGRKTSPWETPEQKIAYCNRFFRMLAPEHPWTVYTALDAYLRSSGFSALDRVSALPESAPEKKWLCRELLGGCLQCSMAPHCPGREEAGDSP